MSPMATVVFGAAAATRILRDGTRTQGIRIQIWIRIRDITKEIAAAVVTEAAKEDLAEGYRGMTARELQRMSKANHHEISAMVLHQSIGLGSWTGWSSVQCSILRDLVLEWPCLAVSSQAHGTYYAPCECDQSLCKGMAKRNPQNELGQGVQAEEKGAAESTKSPSSRFSVGGSRGYRHNIHVIATAEEGHSTFQVLGVQEAQEARYVGAVLSPLKAHRLPTALCEQGLEIVTIPSSSQATQKVKHSKKGKSLHGIDFAELPTSDPDGLNTLGEPSFDFLQLLPLSLSDSTDQLEKFKKEHQPREREEEQDSNDVDSREVVDGETASLRDATVSRVGGDHYLWLDNIRESGPRPAWPGPARPDASTLTIKSLRKWGYCATVVPTRAVTPDAQSGPGHKATGPESKPSRLHLNKNWLSTQGYLRSLFERNGHQPESRIRMHFMKEWLRGSSISTLVKEYKQKRKDQLRIRRAQAHAALSVAEVAAAIAGFAANSGNSWDPALASAASLVAAVCAKAAESMGADRTHVSLIIDSAVGSNSTSNILSLTDSAPTCK
ncbi:NAD-dependent malic enzyme isoform [Nymphaea thermarum]|nr:NAD-dependent malic enzyme isoform [Nymphaea thermarum]